MSSIHMLYMTRELIGKFKPISFFFFFFFFFVRVPTYLIYFVNLYQSVFFLTLLLCVCLQLWSLLYPLCHSFISLYLFISIASLFKLFTPTICVSPSSSSSSCTILSPYLSCSPSPLSCTSCWTWRGVRIETCPQEKNII